MGDITVPANTLMSQITVTVRVTGMAWAMFRVRCAVPLFWLAAMVAGMGVEFEMEQKP